VAVVEERGGMSSVSAGEVDVSEGHREMARDCHTAGQMERRENETHVSWRATRVSKSRGSMRYELMMDSEKSNADRRKMGREEEEEEEENETEEALRKVCAARRVVEAFNDVPLKTVTANPRTSCGEPNDVERDLTTTDDTSFSSISSSRFSSARLSSSCVLLSSSSLSSSIFIASTPATAAPS